MRLENPYHEGELLVQQQVGEAIAAEQNGRVIADSILKGALKFIEQQPMVILGSVWDFEIEQWLEIDLPKLFHWEFFDYSPSNPTTANP